MRYWQRVGHNEDEASPLLVCAQNVRLFFLAQLPHPSPGSVLLMRARGWLSASKLTHCESAERLSHPCSTYAVAAAAAVLFFDVCQGRAALRASPSPAERRRKSGRSCPPSKLKLGRPRVVFCVPGRRRRQELMHKDTLSLNIQNVYSSLTPPTRTHKRSVRFR